MNHHLERRASSCWLFAMYKAVSAWHLAMYAAVSASVRVMHAEVLDRVIRWFVPATDAVPIAPHAITSPTATRGRFMIMLAAATLALKRLSASFVYMGMNQKLSIQFYFDLLTLPLEPPYGGGTPWRNR